MACTAPEVGKPQRQDRMSVAVLQRCDDAGGADYRPPGAADGRTGLCALCHRRADPDGGCAGCELCVGRAGDRRGAAVAFRVLAPGAAAGAAGFAGWGAEVCAGGVRKTGSTSFCEQKEAKKL